MAAYVVQRLGTVMFIMVAMSVLVFLATHALPSNAAALILGQYSTPETQAALEHKLGFDQPLPVQYWRWASHMLQGDMGQSFEMERLVAPILWDAFGRSAILAVSSMAVVSTLGLALGVVAAVWRGRWPDHAASIFTYFGVSLPEFYWGLVFILLFGSTFHLLPSSGYANLSDGVRRFCCSSGAAGGDVDAHLARACHPADALQHDRGARQHVREGGPRARIAGATGDPSPRAAQCVDPVDHRIGAGFRLPDRWHRRG